MSEPVTDEKRFFELLKRAGDPHGKTQIPPPKNDE